MHGIKLQSNIHFVGGERGAPVIHSARSVIPIGTNAFPTLLRMLQAKDSPLKRKLAGVVEHLPLIHYQYWPAESRITAAVRVFSIFRAEAKSAVPDLMEIYESRISDVSQAAAAEVLGYIGRDAAVAVPMLLRGTSNAPARVRAASVQALGEIRASPELVVPGLVTSMSDPDLYVRIAAIDAITKFGDAAKSAVPALVQALGDPNETINASAEIALKIIDRDALEKAREEGKVRRR